MHDYLVIASNESGVKICEIVHLMKEVGALIKEAHEYGCCDVHIYMGIIEECSPKMVDAFARMD